MKNKLSLILVFIYVISLGCEDNLTAVFDNPRDPGGIIKELNSFQIEKVETLDDNVIRLHWKGTESAENYILRKKQFDASSKTYEEVFNITLPRTSSTYVDKEFVLFNKYRYSVEYDNSGKTYVTNFADVSKIYTYDENIFLNETINEVCYSNSASVIAYIYNNEIYLTNKNSDNLGKIEAQNDEKYTSIAFVNDEQIACGTSSGNIFIYDLSGSLVKKHSISSEDIFSLVVTKTNLYYITKESDQYTFNRLDRVTFGNNKILVSSANKFGRIIKSKSEDLVAVININNPKSEVYEYEESNDVLQVYDLNAAIEDLYYCYDSEWLIARNEKYFSFIRQNKTLNDLKKDLEEGFYFSETGIDYLSKHNNEFTKVLFIVKWKGRYIFDPESKLIINPENVLNLFNPELYFKNNINI